MEKVKASKQQNSRIKHGKTEDQPANEKSVTEYSEKQIMEVHQTMLQLSSQVKDRQNILPDIRKKVTTCNKTSSRKYREGSRVNFSIFTLEQSYRQRFTDHGMEKVHNVHQTPND